MTPTSHSRQIYHTAYRPWTPHWRLNSPIPSSGPCNRL